MRNVGVSARASLFLLLLALLLPHPGCRSKPQPPVYPAPPAFFQSPSGFQQQGQPQLMVFFHGSFIHTTIPWEEGLRLAEALFLAQFQGARTPIEIAVLRGGRSYRVNANRLLRGQENPLLEPGDIIEILR